MLLFGANLAQLLFGGLRRGFMVTVVYLIRKHI